jgi:hypothetical protein
VALKGNDHDAIWQFSVARTRCGRCNRFLQQPRREFRIMAILHLPECVVAATKHSRREISGRGSFAFATTRSGGFFSLIERFRTLSVTYTQNKPE